MYLLTDSLLRIKGASSLSAALRRARVVMKDARRDVARSCVIFVDTELDGVLRAQAITTVLFAGVNADQCVLFTLGHAAQLGYDVVLLSDCSGTTSPDYCWDATLYNVQRCLGFVATGADLVDALVAGDTGATA